MLSYINPRSLISQQAASEMSASTIKRLEKHMRTHGFDPQKPIYGVMRADGRILISDGHHRVQAAIRAGLHQVPVEI